MRTIRETPIVPLEDDNINLFAKLEGQNPVGSLKDRPAIWVIHRAAQRGDINPETTLIESSSGNFAAALAFYTRLLNMGFVPVIDPNITEEYESFLRRMCPTVVKVREPDDAGGYLKARLRKVQELRTTIDNSYWTNQYENVDAVEAHYRYTGQEICERFPQLDYIFIGVSTAATIAGISRRVKECFPKVQVIAVDVEGSAIFGDTPKKRHISGIGASIRPPLLDHALIDDVVHVSEVETVLACRELLAKYGLLVGGSSGSCYAAIKQYGPAMRAATPPKVLFICADRGTPYANTVFDNAWASNLAER